MQVRPAVAAALAARRPVVALESTLIAHGLPWPRNLETARAAEAAVRAGGAEPATIAVLGGVPTVGLSDAEVEHLARAQGVLKASSRDLGAAVARQRDAATTVSATMRLARRAGIAVFATGGLGGVHPARDGTAFDVSADLIELGRTAVAVVCAGAKSILDLPATLEVLETHGVPVVGYRTATFPAFYVASSGLPLGTRADDPAEVAAIVAAHWALCETGVVVAQPLADDTALSPAEFAAALAEAEARARRAEITGPALTPFLLAQLAGLTGGKTLDANHALIVANAGLAARIAGELVVK